MAVSMLGKRRLASQAAIALTIILVAGWALAHRLEGLDSGDIAPRLAAIRPSQWMGAIAATLLSFWAVARYDTVAHWALQTGVAPRRAAAAGLSAIALAQVIGLTGITGAVIRWRLLPELTLMQVARLSAMVGLSFLFALGVFAVFFVNLAGGWLGLVGNGTLCLGLWMLLLWPPRKIARYNLPLTGLAWRFGALVLIDVGGAGLALYLLLPPGSIPLPLFLSVFALALGAGLLSGTPGGVGPLELMLLALLPLEESGLMAALLGFRVIYYVAPAFLAAVWFVLCEFLGRGPGEKGRGHTRVPPRLGKLAHAEGRLVELGGKSLLAVAGQPALLTASANGHFVAIGARLGQVVPRQTLTAFRRAAKSARLTPLLYKCEGRMAAQARKAGWSVLRHAAEAVLTPATYARATPGRQLKRKLKQALEGGVSVTRLPANWHQAEMAAIAAEWSSAHGGERGFTMGGFDSLSRQLGPVFGAFHNGRLIAFVSFLAVRTEWSLDLVRHGRDLPQGTMHLLIDAAIRAADSAQVPRLSLAAVPEFPALAALPGRVNTWLATRGGAKGLRQFKASFAPEWEPRYLAAPTWLALCIGLIAVLRQITAGPAKLGDCQIPADMASGLTAADWQDQPGWTAT